MPRSRPASNPLSFHKPTGQFYVTRGGKRIYLGADRERATDKYHRLALRMRPVEPTPSEASISAKDLANRFLEVQQANWRNPQQTLRTYRDWLCRFLKDHPRLRAADLTVEDFAAWKLALKRRGFSPESINHYLSAVRAMYAFAQDSDLLSTVPHLKRIKNESRAFVGSKVKPLYDAKQIAMLLSSADPQMHAMLLLALNCGFGPKDLRDLTWGDVVGGRVTLARSKTGVCQTFLLWPETLQALGEIRRGRRELISRLSRRQRDRSDDGHVLVTRYWRPWNKDAVAEQFRKLCAKAGVPCYGFYRLRHCSSTAISLVANPHVQRRFMRHSQLQQQVTYTHTPDAEVDAAVMKARAKLLGDQTISDQENDRGQADVA